MPNPQFRHLLTSVALVLGMILASACARAPSLVVPDANIVLVVIDALRADHLGVYGYTRQTSPTLDRMAREGIWFERVVTQGGWTRPAIGSLFTSLYPNLHGAVSLRRTLSSDALTLAEALKARGYGTFAVQTNPFLLGGRTFAQGFDSYVDDIIGASGTTALRHFRNELTRVRSRKFFAYVHLMDVHLPYDAPEQLRKKFESTYEGRAFLEHRIRAKDRRAATRKGLSDADKQHVINLYDAGVLEADGYVAELLGDLQKENLLESTIVFVTSDHGEELFEHGSFEHGHSLHGEITHVPLMIRHPAISGGIRVRQLVRHIDIFPTILGFIGASPSQTVMGRDLGPAISDPDADWGMPGFTEGMLEGPDQFAVERGRYKAVRIEPGAGKRGERFELRQLGRDIDDPVVELYDVLQDPGEQHPLGPQHAEHASFARMLEVLRDAGAARRVRPALDPIDRARVEELKSLGYVR